MKRMFFLTAVCSLLASNAVFSEGEPVIMTDRGVINALDFENNTMVIDGSGYVVPLDTTVTIRGSSGAFTLLVVGMKAEVVYKELPTERMALQIDQLPDNTEIEES